MIRAASSSARRCSKRQSVSSKSARLLKHESWLCNASAAAAAAIEVAFVASDRQHCSMERDAAKA
jgi:hypothetical protein